VGDFVGGAVGDLVGAPVGDKLGLPDGIASAQERQHMRETESKEHRVTKFCRTAHSQDLLIPSSAMWNFAKPAASPVHEEQQLWQQFRATSGSAHLLSFSSDTLIAHSQERFPMPAIENFEVVASPLHSDGQGAVGKLVGDGVGIDGALLGIKLGLSDGKASAQVRQHIRETESNAHLQSVLFFKTQSQLLRMPNSAI